MIIWSGFGIVVPLIGLLCLVLSQIATDAILGEGYFGGSTWAKLLAFAITALALWFCGRWMNKPTGEVFINKETGEEFQKIPNHSLFFIPVQYWAFVIIALGGFFAYAW